MEILYLLEKIRMPGLNEFMLLITQLGEETAFLIAALILFWCVDKKSGYYLMAVGFTGTLANQFMKLFFRVPRPWVLDSNFTILEQARKAATGYSFPSGHTQSAVGTFGLIAYTFKNKWVKFIAITIAILVPLSRMYIGVHTPLDVIVSVALAVILIFALKPIVYRDKPYEIAALFAFLTVLAVGFMFFVEYFPFPDDIDAHNLASGVKNAYTLFGTLVGLLIVYIVDCKWINFSTEAVWYVQFLKAALGFVVVLTIKSGLKTPLNLLLGESVGSAVRYLLIVITAGVVWPLTFKLFNKLETKVK